MNLITEFARRDRAAIIARAKEHHRVMEWGAAVLKANREASDELRERFNRHSTAPGISISARKQAAHA